MVERNTDITQLVARGEELENQLNAAGVKRVEQTRKLIGSVSSKDPREILYHGKVAINAVSLHEKLSTDSEWVQAIMAEGSITPEQALRVWDLKDQISRALKDETREV
ncbi:MAG: hypothetical protein M1450_02610 [Patescibacteria group bacterium]|nr:hypothetical protein [Patescibacteria group bacterium]